MSKNLIPLVSIFGVFLLGIVGIYLFLNQNTNNIDSILTVSPAPTNVIINTQNTTPTITQNMNDFTTTKSGLKIKDEVVGTGQEVKSGDTVTVHYLGTLENGTKFDSSYDRNTPFTTQIGVGNVIEGWDEGIVGMKVGGKRKLVIPPNLGYGSQDQGSIPANSTLIFEVELLGVK